MNFGTPAGLARERDAAGVVLFETEEDMTAREIPKSVSRKVNGYVKG